MESYRTWKDLVPAEGGAPARSSRSASPTTDVPARPRVGPSAPRSSAPRSSAARILDRLPDGLQLPDELSALLAEYDRAEQHLLRLTGHLPPDEDPREAARFPIKSHTAASRLEERRLAVLDEWAAEERKRRQEEHLVGLRRAERLVDAALAERDAARRLDDIARSRAERERERVVERVRAAKLTAAVLERWEDDRRRAAATTATRRRAIERHEDRRLDGVRDRLVDERRRRQRDEHRDDARRERAVARRRERSLDG